MKFGQWLNEREGMNLTLLKELKRLGKKYGFDFAKKSYTDGDYSINIIPHDNEKKQIEIRLILSPYDKNKTEYPIRFEAKENNIRFEGKTLKEIIGKIFK